MVEVGILGHGLMAFDPAGTAIRLEDRADPTDLAVAIALVDAIDRDSLSMVPVP